MMNRMVGSVLTLLSLLFSAGVAGGQTYTQMQWGMNKGVTPYTFGANINGTWRDLGTVSAAGVWSIASSNISFTPAGTGAVTTTVQDKLRQTVSVIDFGADPTGVADSAPAFRNAIKSDRNIIIPPGTYTLRSTQPIGNYCSLNLVCAINDPAILIQDQSNFSVSGYGATINVASNIAYSAAFLFLKTNNYTVEGFELNGSRSGMLPTQQNAGFALMSNVDWTIRDINFASGFDDLGSPFVGDWLVNGHIINNRLTNVGQCADFGYIHNITLDGNYSVGASASGTLAGPKCWSFINDPININTNNTGYTITQNEEINLVNNYVTNFDNGALIAAGKGYFLNGNTWERNPGRLPGSKGNGVLIYYLSTGVFPSIGFPPQDITIDGDRFLNNGATVAGAGVLIDSASITNSDLIKNINISNSTFVNNNSAAIQTTTTSGMGYVTVWNNTYENTGPNAVTLSLARPMPFPPADGDLRTNSGANATDAGGSLYFGIGATQSYTPMSQIKGLLVNSTPSELQGGIGFFTRPFGAAGQTLTERMRIAADGASTFTNLATFNTGVAVGVAGTTAGSVAFKNATSGTITLQPATGALGTSILTLPAATGTVTALGNTTTGSGNIVLANTPTLTTPVIGAATGTSLALSGATLGTHKLAVSGTVFANKYTATAASTGSDSVIAMNNASGATTPAQWEQNVSNANGSWYIADITNTKFPFSISLNTPSSTAVLNGFGLVMGLPIKHKAYTIATLPTCNASSLGSITTVSDGTAYATGTYGSAVGATGAVTRHVFCTNTAGATTYAWAYN